MQAVEAWSTGGRVRPAAAATAGALHRSPRAAAPRVALHCAAHLALRQRQRLAGLLHRHVRRLQLRLHLWMGQESEGAGSRVLGWTAHLVSAAARSRACACAWRGAGAASTRQHPPAAHLRDHVHALHKLRIVLDHVRRQLLADHLC